MIHRLSLYLIVFLMLLDMIYLISTHKEYTLLDRESIEIKVERHDQQILIAKPRLFK